jgi:hypothetical protein
MRPEYIQLREATDYSRAISEIAPSRTPLMSLKLHTRPTLMASCCDVSGWIESRCGVTGGSVVSVWKDRTLQAWVANGRRAVAGWNGRCHPQRLHSLKLRPANSHLALTLNPQPRPSTSTRHTGHAAHLNLHGLLLPDTNCCWTVIDANRVCGRPTTPGMGRLSWTVARPMPPDPT